MDPSLKKLHAPRPPKNLRRENHRPDVRKQWTRPAPEVMSPSHLPLRVEPLKPQWSAVKPLQQSGRLLNRPSDPQSKLPFSPYRSVSVLQPATSKPNDSNGACGKTQKEKKAKEPLSAREALRKYGRRLTEFEQKEILEYSEIWYLGLKAQKVQEYNDEEGRYIMVVHDHIAYRYEVLEVMGQGSFGQVLKCRDHKTNEMVAIKILHRTRKESMTEVKILEALLQKDKDTCTNAIQMKEHFVFRKHLCITFELLGANMGKVLQKRHRQGFSKTVLRRFACSMLKCLQVLHDEKIIHADLKPENILMSDEEHCDIKVADFGCSCYEGEQVTNYIGTRWYRAPEVLLHQPYDTAMDMWSFGCVLAELHTGRPIFTGQNELDQLSCIMEVLGMPPAVLTEKSPYWSAFLTKWTRRAVVRSKSNRYPKSRPLVSILGSTDYYFLDFMRRCLTWDPKLRMTPQEAMQHKWIVNGGRSNPLRAHDKLQNEPKDSTVPSFPSLGGGPSIVRGHKAFCEERQAHLRNVFAQNSPTKKSSCKRPAKHPP